MGFPFALKIKDVTPTKEATRVSQLARSKTQNETTIDATDIAHSRISAREKYPTIFLIFPIKQLP